MRAYVCAPAALSLLAEDAHHLAGFVIAHLQPRTRSAYLVTLDVAPANRRQGLARHLLAAVEHAAGAAGADRMHLHVALSNLAAQHLYAACGYTHTGIAPDYYGPGLDAAIYSRALPPP